VPKLPRYYGISPCQKKVTNIFRNKISIQPMRWLNMDLARPFFKKIPWGWGEGVGSSILLDLDSLKCVPQNVPNRGQPHYHTRLGGW
jgi:hypothetical protein